MDLETFIAEALRQIVKGVRQAQQHGDCKGATINSKRRNLPGSIEPAEIEFDVAVTVSEGSERQGKGTIGVASVIGVGGQVKSTTASSTVSRIKFSIPVVLPRK